MKRLSHKVLWIAAACAVAALAIAFAMGRGPAGPEREPASAHKPGYVVDSWQDQRRGRTLKQGEAGRIYQ